jgi:hypothetical protein
MDTTTGTTTGTTTDTTTTTTITTYKAVDNIKKLI